jgi:predicted DNA-binding protein
LTRTTVRLRKRVYDKLSYLKVDTGKNIEDLVDEALREYIDRHG